MSYNSREQSGATGDPYELYLFTATGITYALTSADSPIVYQGQTYSPATISRTEIDQSQESTAGQIKIYLAKGHPLAALFIPYLPPSEVNLVIFGGHHGDAEVVAIFTGHVASARFLEQAELLCVSDADDLKGKIPFMLYQGSCPHVFGSDACGVSLALYSWTGILETVDSSKSVVTSAAFASVPRSLRGGYLKRGNDFRLIVDHSGATVTLMNGIAGLSVGDAVTVVAGCGHTYAECATFNNVDNYLGFDLMPTRNPFDGSLE